MTGRTRATLFAGEGHEHLALAVRATDSREALLQVAAGQEGRHRPLDDRVPKAVLGLETLVVELLEGGEVAVHQTPQVGGLRIAWAVEGQRLDRRRRHDRKGTGPVIVYALSLEPGYTSRQAGRRPAWP